MPPQIQESTIKVTLDSFLLGGKSHPPRWAIAQLPNEAAAPDIRYVDQRDLTPFRLGANASVIGLLL